MRTPPPLAWTALAALRRGLIWLAGGALIGAVFTWLYLDGRLFGGSPPIEPWLVAIAGLAFSERVVIALLALYRNRAARAALGAEGWWSSREAVAVLGRWRTPAATDQAASKPRSARLTAKTKRAGARANAPKRARKIAAKPKSRAKAKTKAAAAKPKAAPKQAAKPASKTKPQKNKGAAAKTAGSKTRAPAKAAAAKTPARAKSAKPGKSKAKNPAKPRAAKAEADAAARHIQSDTHDDARARGETIASD